MVGIESLNSKGFIVIHVTRCTKTRQVIEHIHINAKLLLCNLFSSSKNSLFSSNKTYYLHKMKKWLQKTKTWWMKKIMLVLVKVTKFGREVSTLERILKSYQVQL